MVALLATLLGCSSAKPRFPGTSDIEITSIEIVPRRGEQLEVDRRALLGKLALQTSGAGHWFNAYRAVEDRERIRSFLQNLGYFDAEVDAVEVTHAQDRRHASLTWRVHEGARYAITSVEIVGAPPGSRETLAALIPFRAGDRIDILRYRSVRSALADRLRADGYARAQSYSRTFVDRETKTVAWFYYVDPGPQTRIASIQVEGNHRVSARAIVELTGLAAGRSYSSEHKRRAELALLDSGTFASAVVTSEADDLGPPPMHDDGGVIAPDQVDANGVFVPRHQDAALALRVVVVEAPARQLRAELGVEADPSRVDAYAGARLWLRDVFGPLHHVVLEGAVGRGWLLDADDLPIEGLYGGALIQYLHPGFLVPALELRLAGRWRDTPLPSALLRELTAGPEVRATLARGVFAEGGARYRQGRHLGLPGLDATSAAALQLPTRDDSRGIEVVASVVADRRNDLVEPTAGWLLSARGSYAPGGPLGAHRWLAMAGDARRFVPLAAGWSLATRVTGGAVMLGDANGIPLGPRLFGGGVDGMRGFARDHLSPSACRSSASSASTAMACDVLVGGRSLVESSIEARWLPARALWGATMFIDAGAAGAALNPIASGVSAAVGGGLRIRSWYLPLSFDVAYRILEDNQPAAGWDRVLGFFHLGEAF